MNVFISTAAFALLLVTAANAFAGSSLTLYLDGAQVEQRQSARKGYLEINIPAGAAQNSLRIAPEKGVEIVRVVTTPLKPAKSVEKELGQLAEREEQLNDRLKALSVREEIYKSAAKSQSAKAPRRTKTNPEPLSTIKQGTDYAITQLETVYHSKRKTEKELTQIKERRSRLGKEELSGGTLARVWIAPAAGNVIATWIEPDRNWSPLYQLRIADRERAVLSLLSPEIRLAKGESASLVLALLQAGGKPLKFRYEGEWAVLKKEELKFNSLQEPSSDPRAITFTNSSTLSLPPGDISCFKAGVYIGKGKFQGAAAGTVAEIVCSGS